MQIISPAYAYSMVSREDATNCCDCASLNGFPVLASFTFMPRSNFPEHTRKNATLSRCAGFIFAWILKINPEKSGLSGEITPSVDFRGAGAGAMEINVLKNE